MTEYRLSDALGGHPVNAVSRGNHGEPGDELWKVVVTLADESFPLWLPRTALVEIPPPLPPEPKLHAVVLDGMGHAWQHTSIGWLPGGGGPRSWAEVCRHGAPTLLVLDPFAEPVTLPWEMRSGHRLIEVRRDDEPAGVAGAAFIAISDADEGTVEYWLDSPQRRLLIAALAAADAAEAGAS